MRNEIWLRKADLSDAGLFHQMMVTAFTPLLERYQDYGTNPAAETLEQVRLKMMETDADFYFIVADGLPIGGLRTVLRPEGRRLSPIFILPEHQGRGYAQRAMALLEERYPGTERWFLDTIGQEPGLIHLYKKLGFRRYGEEKAVNEKMTLVYYEKIISGKDE